MNQITLDEWDAATDEMREKLLAEGAYLVGEDFSKLVERLTKRERPDQPTPSHHAQRD